jgi:hypothetical protein
MAHPIAIGTVLEVQDRHGVTNQFVAAGYNENDYLKMTMKTNASIFMTIHPAHAARIASNGSESGIKVLNSLTLADIVVKSTQAIVDVPKPTVTVESNKGKSKKERALDIKAANPNATRKELIAMFVEQLDMTPAGASTYASMK